MSPSLEELEANKKQLLAAIGESSVFLDTTSVSRNSSSVIDLDAIEDSSIDTNNSTINNTIIENSVNENKENSQKAETVTLTEVASVPLPPPTPSEMEDEPQFPEPSKPAQPIDVILGTPVLPSFSSYSTLPSGEAFSKGVCDVIAFENLPDSTGKYDQMRSLISQVRKKVTELHKE